MYISIDISIGILHTMHCVGVAYLVKQNWEKRFTSRAIDVLKFKMGYGI